MLKRQHLARRECPARAGLRVIEIKALNILVALTSDYSHATSASQSPVRPTIRERKHTGIALQGTSPESTKRKCANLTKMPPVHNFRYMTATILRQFIYNKSSKKIGQLKKYP